MTRARKPIRPPVPAPTMLKVIDGPPARPELSWEEFINTIKDLRAAHRYRIENLMMSTSGSGTATMVVALCDQILMAPSYDLASSIAVRSAFQLGGLFAQEWNTETWNAKGVGQVLAGHEVRNRALEKGNDKKALASNPDYIAVKAILDQNPTMQPREINACLFRPLEKRLVQRYRREIIKRG